jgi:Cell wall-active antibiotics response 4TMS YvqF/Domain of unknown function (DUF5668)
MRTSRALLIPPRLVLGLFLVVAGVLLALDRFGVLDTGPIWQFWPVVLVTVGLVKLLGSDSNRGGGVALLLVGSWFLMRNFTDLDLDVSDVLPFAVLLIGLALVSGVIRGRPGRGWGRRGGFSSSGGIGEVGVGSVGNVESGSTVDGFALLGAVARTNNSQSFRGGAATAIAGASEIDLRQAVIGGGSGGEAVIDVFAWWGGVEILVPETWAVDLRGTAILGSFEDLTQPPAGGSSQVLVVKGMVIMGGVEIKNHKREGRR